MPTTPKRLSNLLLNAGLVLGGLVVMVLLYALASRLFMPTVDPLRPGDSAALVGDIIQVEIRNGCGVPGLAAQARTYLRDQGFDVVEVGNHRVQNVALTVVIDRVGNLEAARRVARAMGLPEGRVQQDLSPDYYLDASVIIGQDYKDLPPFQEES